MIVPKMTREQNSNCVLSEKDISMIRIYYKNGIDRRTLRKMFNVSKCTIYYWTVSDKKRKEITAKHNLNRKYKKNNNCNDSVKKRKKLYPLFTKLLTERHNKWLAKNPEYNKLYLRNYRKQTVKN